MTGTIASLSLLASLMAVAQIEASAEPTAAQVAWLRSNGVALTTVEAGNGFKDLEPLRAIIGSARVVGLGEGTHGTREYFQAKHRLVEFLASEMGFTIFSIEANMPEAYALNDYVQGGEGDVNRLIAGMYFWTWNTEEVRDLVEWMRRFNAERTVAGSPARIQFTGFDMQTGGVALRIASDFLKEHDPEFLLSIAPSLGRLATYSPQGGGDAAFGCATGMFPVEAARGKKVRFSGWIRTEGVSNAWAGLWWRVDGPTRFFDNMQDRGPRGTNDWRRVSIDVAVPDDAEAIYFGLVKPGAGKAWFDSLRIEIEGEPWSHPDFDLDFERPQPKGIIAADPMRQPASKRYPGAIDEKIAHTGSASFLLAPVETGDDLTDEEAAAITTSLVDHMVAARDRYAQATDAKRADWAIQNARVVQQWVGVAADGTGGTKQRDKCMAANVSWILEQNPGAKIVLWAHNWHVRDEAWWMGAHLRRAFGADYVNLAFCSSHGRYYARPVSPPGENIHALGDPPAGSFESILEAAGRPILLMDLRAAAADNPGSAWLTEERLFGGVIGAMAMKNHFQRTVLRGRYDLLLYIRDTTAARQLGGK